MCPYYLDGDLRAAYAALGDTRVIGYCAVFKVREEACHRHWTPGETWSRRRYAGLSKLNSMRAASRWAETQADGLARPVDILVPDVLEESAAELESSGGDPADAGAHLRAP
jgi:hypothetical protein